jgi:hypothetical protein
MENENVIVTNETQLGRVVQEKDDTRMNQCNLELLINPLYQKQTGIVKTEKGEGNKHSKTDLKFYRKRILALTNDYIKGNYEQHGTSNEALKQLHFEYVYNVIRYLKMTDKIDIIQNEHNTPPPPPTSTPSTSPMPSTEQQQTPAIDPLYTSVKHVNTLDSYVKRTKKAVKNLISLPVNRVINYHVPELKNKGVKEK